MSGIERVALLMVGRESLQNKCSGSKFDLRKKIGTISTDKILVKGKIYSLCLKCYH